MNIARAVGASTDALVALLTWDRLVPWKVLSLDRHTSDFAPVGFGSRSTVFRGRVRKGTTLWVVTRPRPEKHHPPSLVARITAEGLYTPDDCPARLRSKGVDDLLSQWGWVAVADRSESRFFELNDASPALEDLGIRSFRVMRSFPDGTERVRRAFASSIEQADHQTVFLSHTHAESRSFALEVARALREVGFSPWLDSLTIPMYDVARDGDPAADRLSRLIRLGLSRSRLAVILSSKDYGATEWTRRERRWICDMKRQGADMACVEVRRGGASKVPCSDVQLDEARPSELARSIADWWRGTSRR